MDLGRGLPNMIPQSTSLGSETHDLSSIASPQQHSNPSARVASPILPQNGFFINDEPSDLDWIFQDVRGEYLDAVGVPADCMLPDPMDFGLLGLNPQSQCLNAQEPAASYQLTGDPQESWLLDRPISASQPLDLPELGSKNVQLIAGSYVQLERITDSDRAKMQRSIMHFLERPIWTPVSLATFPSKEKLDHCIDLFFAKFHLVISFIHRPTFNPTTVSEVLVLAIASIGARFTYLDGAAAFANAIAELARRLLLSMGQKDTRVTRSESYITAQLLLGIYGYSSGDRSWFNYSEASRCALVRTAKHACLFQDQPRTAASSRDSTETRWMAWVATERRRRLGWAIYEFDASVSFLHNERPAFSTGDMALSLPCDVARWEAHSAHSWTALCPWTQPDGELVKFRTAARSLFDASLAESVQLSDGQHLYIIVVTLARFLWSIKELQVSPLMDVVPESWPLIEHKSNLLDKLDQYLVSPYTESASETDRNIQCVAGRALIIHTSHLYGSSDLMDWLPAMLRSSGSNQAAKERMMRWGSEDQERLRKVVYHSAQILAICRDFPFNNPYEATYVFYAGAALWCATTMLEAPVLDSATNEDATPLFLDKNATEGEADYAKVVQWIRQGGNFNVGLYGVPVLGTRVSRIQILEETVRVLQNLRVWDLSKAYANVLRQLIRSEGANRQI